MSPELWILILSALLEEPEPWPGPLTYLGLALLLVAALMTLWNRRKPK